MSDLSNGDIQSLINLKGLTVQTEKINIHDFVYVKVIGRGLFGKVFLAKRVSDGKFYAIKKIRKDQVIEAGVLDKVLIERQIMARLNNPYICKLHFSFQTQTTLYLVMDFFNGGELFNQIHTAKNKKMSEKRILQYASQIVCILAYLHKNGIVYRDIKPENIILDSQGHINFIDMGLALQDH